MEAYIAIPIIIGLAVVIVVVIVAVVIRRRQRGNPEDSTDQKELNDQYGTYYEGVEYNIATEDNPRYNEDGVNDDAVATDANVDYYYQLPTSIDDNNLNRGNNDASSPNGNIYSQL